MPKAAQFAALLGLLPMLLASHGSLIFAKPGDNAENASLIFGALTASPMVPRKLKLSNGAHTKSSFQASALPAWE